MRSGKRQQARTVEPGDKCLDDTLPRVLPRQQAADTLHQLLQLHAGNRKVVPDSVIDEIWDTLLAPLYDLKRADEIWPNGLCRLCYAPHPERWALNRKGPWPGHFGFCPRHPLYH